MQLASVSKLLTCTVPCSARILLIVLRPSSCPRFLSAPRRRVYPHVGFSLRHAHNEFTDILRRRRSAWAPVLAAIVLGCDEVAVPAQKRSGCGNGRNLGQRLAAQSLGLHFNVTEHPSAEWTAQQMVDAFPWDTAPRYLVRDRDQSYGAYFDSPVDGLGIEQVLTAPRSPWQNPFVERMIGSIRRECLDHVIVLDERHLKRILRKYVDYYHSCRTHLSLEKDAPEPRRVESPAMGKVRAISKVGGLHHYYTRRAA